MIILKTSAELALMKKAGSITAGALETAGKYCKPGNTTAYIAGKVRDYISMNEAKPSFLGYGGFKDVACISVNNEVIHGIPGNRKLQEGDIVSVDVGAIYRGYHGDSAYTFPVGNISTEAKKLLETTERCLYLAIEKAVVGARIGDISNAVQTEAVKNKYGVVRDFVGHGIGKSLHESPEVPNFGTAGKGIRLTEGMTLAIEPMINAGTEAVYCENDKWTIKTKDGSLSAHFEHTIAITTNGPVILTIHN